MRRVLAFLMIVILGDVIPCTTSHGDPWTRPSETRETEIPLYGFTLAGGQLRLTYELMSVNWARYDTNVADMNPPKLVSGGTYTAQLTFSSGARYSRGQIGRKYLAPIDVGGPYWRSIERAYPLAVQYTEVLQKVGILEINRMVDGLTVPDADEGYPASIALGLMSLFHAPYSRDRFYQEYVALLGTLQPDGRIGPVSRVSEKVALLLTRVPKILIPSGQLAMVDPAVLNQLYQHHSRIEEVDTLEQAYQLMGQSPW